MDSKSHGEPTVDLGYTKSPYNYPPMGTLAIMLLWYSPSLIIVLFTAIIPDTFLDSPGSTIPHEAAYRLHFDLFLLGLAYTVIVFLARNVLPKDRFLA